MNNKVLSIIDRIWSGKSLLWIFLWPLSVLYGVITALIRYSFQYGLLKSWRAACPIIVVGNLTSGGTGKTPLVIWLIDALKKKGIRVGVVLRGYGGKSHYPLLVTSQTPVLQSGDEALLIVNRTEASVVVAPNRCLAVKKLLNTYKVDVIISDDGLQHYALKRDREIVIVDGIRRFGNGWWLPAGPMRERTWRLNTVDAVVINDGYANNDNEISMTLKPGLAINLVTKESLSLNQLPSVVAIAGIGYPPRFFNMLKKHGVNLLNEISFKDHHRYKESDLINLTKDHQCLIMTEKDAVKCSNFARLNWWYVPVNTYLNGEKVSRLLEDIVKLCTLSS